MAPCAIALQQLDALHICHGYNITVALNFNALKSICFVFTPILCRLVLPQLHINNVPLQYHNVDSVKYLGITFASAHKDDGTCI